MGQKVTWGTPGAQTKHTWNVIQDLTPTLIDHVSPSQLCVDHIVHLADLTKWLRSEALPLFILDALRIPVVAVHRAARYKPLQEPRRTLTGTLKVKLKHYNHMMKP